MQAEPGFVFIPQETGRDTGPKMLVHQTLNKEKGRLHEVTRNEAFENREAAWLVMPRAYLKASSGGTLPAHARQIMYAARGEIQRLTGRRLDDQYFTQQLLPDFMNEHPSATAEWDVVFDTRGHFHEPHTGRIVPLGTIEVRRHLHEVAEHTLPELQVGLPDMAVFPTCGPDHRYGAILFVEEEGFLPLFRAVHLAERYDVAIMSTKGLSVTASRLLVDRLCAVVEPGERRLVWLRAEGLPWKRVTDRLGIGRTTAWQRWTMALLKIAIRLN